MYLICSECGHEAPQHADWCSQRTSNIELCPICRGARGKHAPYCGIGGEARNDRASTEESFFKEMTKSLKNSCGEFPIDVSYGVRKLKFPSLDTSSCVGFSVLGSGPTTNDRVNKLETELREYKRRLNKLESGR